MNGTRKIFTLSAKISLLLFAMIFVSTVSLGIISYVITKQQSVESKALAALDIAKSVSTMISADAYKQSMANFEQTENWHQVKDTFNKVKERTGVKYLYVVDANYQNGVVFYLEGEKPGDDSSSVAFLGEVDDIDNFADEMYESIDKGIDTITAIYDSGDYGMLVAGTVPLFDENNRVYAVVCAEVSVEEALASAQTFGLYLIVIIVILNAVFVTLAVFYTRKKIGAPLTKITQASMDIANGNIDVVIDIRSNDELGLLSAGFEKVSASLHSLLHDIEEMSDEQQKGNTDHFIDTSRQQGSFRRVAEGINHMAKQFAQDTSSIMDTVKRFGNGDFNAKIEAMPGKKADISNTLLGLKSSFTALSGDIQKLVFSASAGNLTQKADPSQYKGDWASIIKGLNDLTDIINNPLSEVADIMNKMAVGDFSVTVTGQYNGAFLSLKNAVNATIENVSLYIDDISSVLKEMAHNNFDLSIQRNYVGEFSIIKDSLVSIIENINPVIHGIVAAANEVSTGAHYISENSSVLAEGAGKQTSAIDSLSASFETIGSQTMKNTETARHANALSAQSKQNAAAGNSQMKNMLTSISGIKSASEDIAKIIKAIEDIAFQTNLLALNAAVESARAGEHGKGFAVVAEEVRNLANRSQEAAKETNRLIQDTVTRVEEGSKIAQETAESLHVIVADFDEVSKLIEQISATSGEQSEAIGEVNTLMRVINEVVQTNSGASQEAAASSEELAGQSEALKGLIGVFRYKH